MMTPGERFMRTLSFQSVDRIPCMDFGYWRMTIENWHKQGLPQEIDSTEDVEAYFGCDRGFETNLVNYWGDKGPIGIKWRVFPEWTKFVISEDDEHITYGGEIGVVTESKISESIPHQSKYPVENDADYDRMVLSRLNAWDPGRITPEFQSMLLRSKEQGQAIGMWIDGFFAWPRELMGPEKVLFSYYDEPELMHKINRNHAQFVKDMIDMILTHTPLDYACFFEDMAYNQGSFISNSTFDEFMTPYYQEVVSHLRKRGVKKILIDSDGNSVKLSDKFVEVGADGHYPLEVKSGSHPELIRARHPNLAMIGGIDKFMLSQDRAAIDKELSKLPPLLEKGGFIPSLDHRVQPDVPMSNYQYYVERKKEIMQKYCY